MSGPDIAQPAERQRQHEALKLRLEGRRWADIAEALGYRDHSGAFRAVEGLLKRVESHAAEEYRKLEDERLDALLATYWPAAVAGDIKAAEFVVKLHDRRVKLHGLALPEKVVLQQINVGMSYEEFSTTVTEDLRAIGYPVTSSGAIDAPLKPEDPAEPWANT